jgi:hypothetical protein
MELISVIVFSLVVVSIALGVVTRLMAARIDAMKQTIECLDRAISNLRMEHYNLEQDIVTLAKALGLEKSEITHRVIWHRPADEVVGAFRGQKL